MTAVCYVGSGAVETAKPVALGALRPYIRTDKTGAAVELIRSRTIRAMRRIAIRAIPPYIPTQETSAVAHNIWRQTRGAGRRVATTAADDRAAGEASTSTEN